MGFPTDAFSNYISNAPLADTPGSSDMLALIQNNITKRLPVGQIPGLTPIVVTPTTIITTPTYDVLPTDYALFVNQSPAEATTINLRSSPGGGKNILIKDIAGNVSGTYPITIANGTIDGQTGYILPFAYSSLWLLSTGIGNNWAIIARLIG